MQNETERKIRRLFEELQPLQREGRRIRIIAVSKKKSLEEMRRAVAAGIRDLGENRIQEAEQKFSAESFPGIERHFIAPIQSNKLSRLLQYFHWFHGLESLKIADAVDRAETGLKCLIEVNTTGDPDRHGVPPGEVRDFVLALRDLKKIQIRGLMTMAPFTEDEGPIRASFRTLAELGRQLKGMETENIHFEELSMGMSGDYRIALEEGATMLRIGSGIFGERT